MTEITRLHTHTNPVKLVANWIQADKDIKSKTQSTKRQENFRTQHIESCRKSILNLPTRVLLIIRI